MTMPNWSAMPGESMIFGAYPQTGSGAGRTPIAWRVLQNSAGELFLLSEYILDCKRYEENYLFEDGRKQGCSW